MSDISLDIDGLKSLNTGVLICFAIAVFIHAVVICLLGVTPSRISAVANRLVKDSDLRMSRIWVKFGRCWGRLLQHQHMRSVVKTELGCSCKL